MDVKQLFTSINTNTSMIIATTFRRSSLIIVIVFIVRCVHASSSNGLDSSFDSSKQINIIANNINVSDNSHRRQKLYRTYTPCQLTKTLHSYNGISRGGGAHLSNAKQTQPTSTKASRQILRSMRILYLTYYASLGALMPYLPVYFHSLGHSGSAIGMLGAVKPLTTFLVAPLWGILSDQYGNHVSLLQFTFVTSLVFQLMVGWGINLNFLMVSVFITALLNAPVKSLIDTVVMEKLTSDEDRYRFGQLRLWGQIGFGVGSSLVGSLLSMFPPEDKNAAKPNPSPSFSFFSTRAAAPEPNHPTFEKVIHGIETGIEVACETDACAEIAAVSTDEARNALFEMTSDLLGKKRWNIGSTHSFPALKGYAWAFFIHGLLSIPTLLAIRAFQPEKKVATQTKDKNKPAEDAKKKNISEGLRLLSQNSDALVFFFLVFVIGTSSGCIENFAYVRVREVGGTGNQMGILRLVSSLAGAPMFWYSGPLTEYLGVDAVLVLSLLAYVVRFFNYAYIHHPYHALPAEALRGITFALFWSSGSAYAYKISPPGMAATMLMILNAMYGGLGQSLGAIIGGKMQSKLGTIGTFKYSGLFDLCFVGGLVLYLSSKISRSSDAKFNQ
jgi:predicted MFS family arabinose efflux permease